MNLVAVRKGFTSRQITGRQSEFPPVPGTQQGTLYRTDVKEGGNDIQIQRAYGPNEIARISSTDPSRPSES